ncbi:putative WRKY transcription factor 72 [Salvia divinorum]|uniref:WRKY transcription factor 72 n=1 Tax=Salvia divinorum TaxID=28513 RepID=A0ABD1H7Q9_SALDI
MNFKGEERMNMPSNNDEVEETLNTETLSMEEANMTRAKVKMEEVRKENERLKVTLSQIMEDYSSLKEQFNGIADQSKKARNLASMADSDDESELVCLSLGRFSGPREEKKKMNKTINLENGSNKLDGIELGLNSCRPDNSVEVSRNSLDESKEEGSNDVRSSAKHSRITGDEEILQQNNPVKKPRVSVRAHCNTQTMHDGCQWRKYGQKIAKGNPCPRAYYRCTVSSSCPVRKQVQRCVDDMSILITTYEGTHNHPLPPSAAAMASATSSAATMLSCGSTTSPSCLTGYNFSTASNFSRATISSSQSHPTVILDLTAPNHHSNRFSSALFPTTRSSLNFSSNFPSVNSMATAAAPHSQPPLFSGVQKQAGSDQKIATAIAHDPSFQSALAAAFTSIVAKNKNSGMNFQHLNFAQPSTSNGCAASFMSRLGQPMNSQQHNLTMAASKSRAMSLADEGEHLNL